MGLFGRGDWIRTSDLFVPNEARYQAAPRPETNGSPGPEPEYAGRKPNRHPLDAAIAFPWRSPPLNSILEELRAVVVEQSDGTRSAEDVGAGDRLYDCGHLDSMGAVALLTFIEDRFDVVIDDAELVGPLGSLDALARHIAEASPVTG